MYKTKYVNSGLITGTQWDTMINTIYKKDSTKQPTSYQWGNFINQALSYKGRVASYDANRFLSTFGDESQGNIADQQIYTTGASKQAEAYHLFDVAGNVWEKTEEITVYSVANQDLVTINRGGGSINVTNEYPAIFRNSMGIPNVKGTNALGFRMVLYIK
ncbi:MAG: hypothetical protein ACLTEH_04945 [Clostridia bacterium]